MTQRLRPPRRRRLLAIALALVTVPMAAQRGSAEERVLTLEEALTTAQTKNPALVGARETASAAGFRANQARAGYLPQASMSLSYSRATFNFTPRPGYSFTLPNQTQSLDSGDYYSAALNLNQMFYDFGRTGGVYSATASEAEAVDADVETTLDNVSLAVTQTFFGVLASQELLASALQTKHQMEQHLELAQAQVKAGARPLIDVTRAKADLANAKLALVRAKNQLAIAKACLNATMGEKEAVGDYAVAAPPKAPTPPVTELEEGVRTALEKRSDYRAQKSRVESLRSQVTVARSGYFPTLSANGNVA